MTERIKKTNIILLCMCLMAMLFAAVLAPKAYASDFPEISMARGTYSGESHTVPCVAVYDDEDGQCYALTDSDASDLTGVILITDYAQYSLSYAGDLKTGLSVWTFTGNPSTDPCILRESYAVQGERDTLVCFVNSDGECDRITVTMEELDSDNGVYTVSGLPSTYLKPAAIVDSYGNCVAIAGENSVSALYYSDSSFYGSSGSQSTASSSPTPTPVPTAAPTPEVTPVPEVTPTPVPETKASSGSTVIIVAVSAAVVAVAAAVVIIVVVSRKKKAAPVNGNNGYPQNPQYPQNNAYNAGNYAGGMTEFLAPNEGHTGAPSGPIAPQIVCISGMMRGTVLDPGRGDITIGRDPGATLAYPADAPGVSRAHARIIMQNGYLVLIDVGSTNGTYVEGLGRLTPNQPVQLHAGDIFYIGIKDNSFEVKS